MTAPARLLFLGNLFVYLLYEGVYALAQYRAHFLCHEAFCFRALALCVQLNQLVV